MIRQSPGDVLEICFEDRWICLVVVTKIFMFGGNIVYVFHGDGSRIEGFAPSPELPGFNICTDFILPKREGQVNRITRVPDPMAYLVSNLVKSCHEHELGQTAKRWFLSKVQDPNTTYKTVRRLSKTQAMAMDSGMYSFDLTVEKALAGYTPDKNPFIGSKRGLLWFLP